MQPKYKVELNRIHFFIMVFLSLTFLNCEKEELAQEEPEVLTSIEHRARRKKKIKICYVSRWRNQPRIIKIRPWALKWFEKKGAVRLDDQDGDGFVPDNACGYGQMGDCDDKDPNVNPNIPDSCGDAIDSDGDGIADSEDKCPEVAGFASLNGCPDADGDGIADKDDECPNEAGSVDNLGCPSLELSDYEVLRLLYESNPDNTLSWDLNDTTMESWFGIQVNEEGEIITLEFSPATPSNITFIPKEIGMLEKLENLLLTSLDLETIPKEIGDLSNLKWLDISRNKLTSIPIEIGNLTNLTILDLSVNGFSELPAEIGNLSNLEELNLWLSPFLNELPEELGQLTNLKKLTIGQAIPIQGLPNSLQNLRNLEELTIHNTPLSEIPQWIGMLTTLNKLYLTSGQFRTLPKEIGNLNNLKILDLANGQLSEVPEDLSNLNALELLGLSNNPVIIIPQAVCDLADADTEVRLDTDDFCQ